MMLTTAATNNMPPNPPKKYSSLWLAHVMTHVRFPDMVCRRGRHDVFAILLESALCLIVIESLSFTGTEPLQSLLRR